MLSETADLKEDNLVEPKARKFSVIAKRRKLIKPSELIIGATFIIIVVVLAVTLVKKLALMRDAANAQKVSSQVMTDINKRDGAGIRSLGSPDFQHTYTAAALTQGFTDVEVATYKTPALLDKEVVDTPNGRVVYFLYKYSALKVPFYVRTEIEHRDNHWYLINISGTINESQLTGQD